MMTQTAEAHQDIKTLLLIDDDRLILSTLTKGLTRAGYIVSAVESVREAEVWLSKNDKPDLVVLDVRMPERDGLEFSKLLSLYYQIPFIMLSAHSDVDIVGQASTSGALSYVVKPVDITQLIPAIETAILRGKELNELRLTKVQLQTALDADRSVSVAVGIIMDQHRLGQAEALCLLRDTARSKQLKMVDLAAQIISSRDMLSFKKEA
ncbi:MAG: response regulator [Nitrosomonadales bacterium]|nr:response regulator [Nitrosomonadales bacterium]